MARKIIIGITIAVVVIAAIFITLFSMSTSKLKKQLMATTIEDIELADVKDGEYKGEYDLKMISAKVSVFVKDSKIINIVIDEHKHGRKYGAEAILDKIKQAQSLDVDAVSGATGSSIVVRKAVELALKNGLGKIEEEALEAAAREEEEEFGDN